MNTIYVDKRKNERMEINTPGKIIRLRGLRLARSISCVVINISEGGALIQADVPVADAEFYLELNSELGSLRLCSVVRRLHSNFIGVQFVAAAEKYK